MTEIRKHASELSGSFTTIKDSMIVGAYDPDTGNDLKFTGALINAADAALQAQLDQITDAVDFVAYHNGTYYMSSVPITATFGSSVTFESYIAANQQYSKIEWTVLDSSQNVVLTSNAKSVTLTLSADVYSIYLTVKKPDGVTNIATKLATDYLTITGVSITGSASFTVTDQLTPTSNPLVGALVTIYLNGSQVSSGSTDVNGAISFTGLDSGSYTYTVSLPYFHNNSGAFIVVATDVPVLVTMELDAVVSNLSASIVSDVISVTYTFMPDASTYEGVTYIKYSNAGISGGYIIQLKGDTGFGTYDVTGLTGSLIVEVYGTTILGVVGAVGSNLYKASTVVLGNNPIYYGIFTNYMVAPVPVNLDDPYYNDNNIASTVSGSMTILDYLANYMTEAWIESGDNVPPPDGIAKMYSSTLDDITIPFKETFGEHICYPWVAFSHADPIYPQFAYIEDVFGISLSLNSRNFGMGTISLNGNLYRLYYAQGTGATPTIMGTPIGNAELIFKTV